MPKVKLDALREGMVAAADVKNLEDMLLLPAGCELTARHIRILQTWGIPEVAVQDSAGAEVEEDPLEKLPPGMAERLEAEVKRLFWGFDESNSVQKEMVRLTLVRKARQVLARQPKPIASPVARQNEPAGLTLRTPQIA